jgi:hypothetical protein
VKIAEWFGNWDVHLFNFSNWGFELFQIFRIVLSFICDCLKFKRFLCKEEPKWFIGLTPNLFEDHIVISELQSVCCRFSYFWLVARTQNFAGNLHLRCFDAKVLVNLAFISLLNTKGRYKIDRSIHHNQAINLRVLLPSHHREPTRSILFIYPVYKTWADVALRKLILYFAKNSLQTLHRCLDINLVGVIVVQKVICETSR